MKKLFVAIRNNDIEVVKTLLEKKPELICSTAKQPPKKDDGQSPLQVSLKCRNFEITDLLLSLGADVNFMESKECCNTWRAPVIHDAVIAAVKCSRYNTTAFGLKVHNTKEDSEKAYLQLEKIIQLGADVNARDSYGNSCLNVACSSALEILPRYNYVSEVFSTERVFTEEVKSDLSKIFNLLLEHGADVQYIAPNNTLPIVEFYKKEHISGFLD